MGALKTKLFGAYFSIMILLCYATLYSLDNYAGATLEASLCAEPLPATDKGKIHPLGKAQVKAKIKNVGQSASCTLETYVRFVLPEPLRSSSKNDLYESEIVKLSSIAPGEEKEVVFEKLHQYPAVSDFIRYDWPMRQYEAIIRNGQEESVIGSLSMTISGHYYCGPSTATPAAVPSLRYSETY